MNSKIPTVACQARGFFECSKSRLGRVLLLVEGSWQLFASAEEGAGNGHLEVEQIWSCEVSVFTHMVLGGGWVCVLSSNEVVWSRSFWRFDTYKMGFWYADVYAMLGCWCQVFEFSKEGVLKDERAKNRPIAATSLQSWTCFPRKNWSCEDRAF